MVATCHHQAAIAGYDRMSAHELFLRFGLSDRLVRDFIRPTLLVGCATTCIQSSYFGIQPFMKQYFF
jgi:hypothetical protein